MFKNLFSFDGRIRRTEYGITLLIYLSINMAVNKMGDDIFFAILVATPILWFVWSQGAKRCHDIGKSGWWQIIPFYVLWLIFQEGNLESNKYGENPKRSQINNNKNSQIEQYNKKNTFIILATIGLVLLVVFSIYLNQKSSSASTLEEITKRKKIAEHEKVIEREKIIQESLPLTYYDNDISTGWETTVIISEQSFECQTISQTGEIVASGSGIVDGSSLIDSYGQNIGSFSESFVQIKLGAATIYCRRK